jgi:hypothetical protein
MLLQVRFCGNHTLQIHLANVIMIARVLIAFHHEDCCSYWPTIVQNGTQTRPFVLLYQW